MKRLVKEFHEHGLKQRNTKRTSKMLCDAAFYIMNSKSSREAIIVGATEHQLTEMKAIANRLFNSHITCSMVFVTRSALDDKIRGRNEKTYKVFYDHFALEAEIAKLLVEYTKYEEN
ncbi:hypothetical protein FKOIJHOC_00077 [Acinetobacter phage Ab_121]|nr:hypothetical protein FKOIJHOC_00077 [Acinetobacter phage Ab_121]QQV88835.1 hypothetical protein Liucustia_135 [Acinetobacter phage Liucustia]